MSMEVCVPCTLPKGQLEGYVRYCTSEHHSTNMRCSLTLVE
uniref:Uncharacterized protein n=1 Tax=Anguilla anguilla TaxID=7936 RepID=A0A0E9WLJ3_ANGAN